MTMLYCTKGIEVIETSDSEIGTDIDQCNHVEADIRLIFHALHCAAEFLIDLWILTLPFRWPHSMFDELLIAFGVKTHYRYIAVHTIANKLGRDKSRALPYFHALTGCETTSSFSNVGKKTAGDT